MPSSVVSTFFYNSLSCTLRVIFTSGLIYDYKNVPAQVYQAMTKTASKGRYLNQHIKGRYDFSKIETTDNSQSPRYES